MGNDLISSLSFAASGMEAQAMRLRHVSENIANADTPGYHRKVVSFERAMETGLVAAGPVRLDRSELARVYDPGHPLADATGHYDGSNVDLVIEIA
ncbi:MAG: flagellar basal body protein, partial [Tabrizicola flagellatus]|uniref:flagellar basal body protein n=1 Tax=Tabrizicola flagellatus TaxID=2593021 RepID=UPI003918A8B0